MTCPSPSAALPLAAGVVALRRSPFPVVAIVLAFAALASFEIVAPSPAAAEDAADGLTRPRAGIRARRHPPRARTRPGQEEAEPEEAEPWQGPRVELGYAHYAISDGFGGGDVHVGTFGGFLPLGSLRLGANVEGGSRHYSLGTNDALVRASALVGYQYVGGDPWMPYIAAVGSLGAVFGKRFHTPISHTLLGAGLEAGLDVRFVRTLYAGVGLGYLRATMAGLAYDVFQVRFRVGL